MQLKRIESISIIEKQFTTNGSTPVLVLTNDYNDYVCKYQKMPATNFSGLLINEYLASCFLNHWEINTPNIGCVNVKASHVNVTDLALQPSWFTLPCFGSLYNKYFKEIDSFTSEISLKEKKGMNTDDLFLKIALFDIWVSNEDRHQGNFNLMKDTTNNNILVAIDHGAIFNSNTLRSENPIYVITYEDSLLSSPLLLTLYSKKMLRNQVFLEQLRRYYYICVNSCELNLPAVINNLPNEWCHDKANLEILLRSKIFQDDWKEECWNTFLEFIQYNTHN